MAFDRYSRFGLSHLIVLGVKLVDGNRFYFIDIHKILKAYLIPHNNPAADFQLQSTLVIPTCYVLLL